MLECYIAYRIWTIVPLILVIVGVTGNVLNLVALSSRRLRKKSTCVYLMFLAVSDTVLLCSAPLIHTVRIAFAIDMWSLSSFSCPVTEWIVHSSGTISCWIIVMVTAERTLLTLFPTMYS